MGKHLEKLKQFMYRIPPMNQLEARIFTHMIKTISNVERNVFELPFIAPQIPKLIKKNDEEYTEYLNDYLDLSKESGKAILTPYTETAIEDPQGIVIFDSIEKDSFNILSFIYDKEKMSHLCFSNIKLLSNFNDNLILGKVIPGYGAIVSGNNYYPVNFKDHKQIYLFGYDVFNATTSGIEELAYLSDPNNSLISKERMEKIKKETDPTMKNDPGLVDMLKLMEQQYGKHNLN